MEPVVQTGNTRDGVDRSHRTWLLRGCVFGDLQHEPRSNEASSSGEGQMKTAWLASLLFLATQVWPQTAKTFRGEIADSQCALNVHSLTRSHREMLKGKLMGDTAQSCSRMCVEHYGGHYVLQDKDDVFNLD